MKKNVVTLIICIVLGLLFILGYAIFLNIDGIMEAFVCFPLPYLFWFILGMDSVVDFPRWRRAEELVGLCDFIAFDRPGVEPPEKPFDSRLLVHRLRGPLMDVSSTAIRAAVAKDAAMRYPINDFEARYLRAKALYHR